MIISVIIPTYNRNKILCNTIEQILNQDFKNFELLIVDQSHVHDDSTTKFLSSLPENSKVLKHPNANLPEARNVGIRESTGNIIVFIDDDMHILENTLSKVASTFNDNKNILALTGFMKGTASLAGYFHKKKISRKYESIELLKVKHFLGGFMCFRKSIFDKVGYFDEWIGTQPTAAGEDLEFSLRLLRKGYSLYLDKRIVVEHIGKSLINGGYDKSSLTIEENKYWLMRNNLYLQYKNRKFKNTFGSFLAFWNVYRGFIINKSTLRNRLSKILANHKIFNRIRKEIISVAKANIS